MVFLLYYSLPPATPPSLHPPLPPSTPAFFLCDPPSTAARHAPSELQEMLQASCKRCSKRAARELHKSCICATYVLHIPYEYRGRYLLHITYEWTLHYYAANPPASPPWLQVQPKHCMTPASAVSVSFMPLHGRGPPSWTSLLGCIACFTLKRRRAFRSFKWRRRDCRRW